MDETRELLRHSVATLAYRAARAVNDAPESFAGFDGAGRRPDQILAHMGDLLDWSLSMADGKQAWHDSPPLAWERGTARFFAAIEAFDRRSASDVPPACPAEKLFQGPIADALTHVGQIAMLRRLAGCPFHGENYFLADIVTGRVGAEQAKPAAEF